MKVSGIVMLLAPLGLLATELHAEPRGQSDPIRLAQVEAKLAALEATEAQEEANKQLVRSFFEGTLSKEQRDTIIHKDYIQHSPQFSKYGRVHGMTGAQVNAHLFATAQKFHASADAADPKRPPRERVTQIGADGDLVFMIRTVYEQDPTEPPGVYYGYNTFELLRIKDGKFYEHWDYGRIRQDDPFLSIPPPGR